MFKYRLSALGSAFLLIISLAACGTGSTSSEASSAAGSASVTASSTAESAAEETAISFSSSAESTNSVPESAASDPASASLSEASDSTAGQASDDKADLSDVKIDYGSSSIYSQDDMDDAIALIEQEFSTWNGCVLHSISYTSDDCDSQENIDHVNELGEAAGLNITFTQCIIFSSTFHSPKAGSEDVGAWNPDEEYTGWEWYLAREDGGEWHLLDWGY